MILQARLLTWHSNRISFAQLGLEDAAVTDATIKGNALAIASHTGGIFQLHAIKLDVLKLQAEYLYSESFTNGEVTSFDICRLEGKVYAVACLWWEKSVCLDFFCLTDRERVRTISLEDRKCKCHQTAIIKLAKKIPFSVTGIPTATEPFTSIVLNYEEATKRTLLIAGTRDGLLVTASLRDMSFAHTASSSFDRMSLMPVNVYPARHPGQVFICSDSSFVLASDFREGRGFARKRSIWTVDAEDSSRASPIITSVTVLPRSLSGNEANTPLLLLATDHVLLAELQPQVGPVQRQIALGMTPSKLLYSHVLKCLVVAARTASDKTTLKFIDPDTGEDLSLPVDGNTKDPVRYISGLGRTDDRILSLEEWHVRSESGNGHYFLLLTTSGGSEGGRVLIVSPKIDRPGPGLKRGKIRFWTRYKLKKAQDENEEDKIPAGPITAVTTFGRKIQSSMGTQILFHELDESQRKITQGQSQDIGGPAWKLSILPNGSRTLALVKGDSLRVLEESHGQSPQITHVERTTRSPMDMLEVAGAWEGSVPTKSEPPKSIVLLSDQNCSVKGLGIPWDSPGQDCEAVFETGLPSSVRRLRLGRTLPAWSREIRRQKKFGLLPASIDDAEILGMGIDGSLQHFTLLDVNAWRFLRFVQNISETSADLYPFTHVPFEDLEDQSDDDSVEAFDPTPVVDHGLEMQIDGDLMQRCLDKKALEALVSKNEEWMEMFVEYLDQVDGGMWTTGFQVEDHDEDTTMDVDQRRRRYFDLAYEILEYYLVPVI